MDDNKIIQMGMGSSKICPICTNAHAVQNQCQRRDLNLLISKLQTDRVLILTEKEKMTKQITELKEMLAAASDELERLYKIENRIKEEIIKNGAQTIQSTAQDIHT